MRLGATSTASAALHPSTTRRPRRLLCWQTAPPQRTVAFAQLTGAQAGADVGLGITDADRAATSTLRRASAWATGSCRLVRLAEGHKDDEQ